MQTRCSAAPPQFWLADRWFHSRVNHPRVNAAESALRQYLSGAVVSSFTMLRRVFLSLVLLFLAVPASASELYVLVDISEQSMAVRLNGELKYTFDVSTGRKGYSTPTGAYGVTRMYRKYHSKKYDGAPMPYSIFFHGGYAIHGTTDLKRLGRIASHGCVRLHPDNAKMLFALVQEVGSENTNIWVKR